MASQSQNTSVGPTPTSNATLARSCEGVFIRCALMDSQIDRIREQLPAQCTVHVADVNRASDEEAIEMLNASQVAFGQVPPRWLDGATQLEWLQLDSVGFDPYLGYDLDGRDQPLVMTNLRDLFSVPVAETVLAGLLALYRGIDPLQAARPQQDWCRGHVRSTLRCLSGANVLLAGYGSIGQAMDRIFKAMGCTVTAFARTNPEAQLHTVEALDQALPDADVVCLSLPETDQTAGLFDAQRLAKLRDSAVLVNVGRAGVVDEAALVDALNQRRLAGAVLDVTQAEPLPEGDPLWSTPNTILTQHTGGGFMSERQDKVTLFLENFERYRSGESLNNTIQLKRGY